jgi:hypothetical protein
VQLILRLLRLRVTKPNGTNAVVKGFVGCTAVQAVTPNSPRISQTNNVIGPETLESTVELVICIYQMGSDKGPQRT